MLLIAIVDDSPQDADILKGQIEQYLTESKEPYLIHVYHDGVEFIRSPEEHSIAFLDIHMEKIDGLEAAHFIRKISRDTILIFVTGMAQMAIRGYEVDALDFIIKPTDQHSIDRVMNKAIKRIQNQLGVTVVLKTTRDIISISSNKIYFIEVYDHDLIYHTEQGEYRVRGQLYEARKQLDEKQFILCHRSYLVNLRHISSVHDEHLIVNGKKVLISKSHRKEIERRFVSYLGENL